MDSIYVNNFRGFNKTILPIRPVNFFVGENSTGKTSLLALLDLFSQPEFWFNINFNAGSYEFGNYKDIVSASSKVQDELQIGLCRPDQKRPERSASYMIHFNQAKNGLPQLIRFSQLCEMYYVTMQVINNEVAVQLKTNVPSSVNCSSAEQCFRYMQKISHIKTDYQKISDEIKHMLGRASIYNFPIVLSHIFKDAKLQKKFNSLPFPGLRANLASMAPIRTKPKRTYDGYTRQYSPEGEHTPYVIKENLSQGRKNNSFREALDAFGKDSGLFETVGVSQFGRDDSSAPFELTVTLNSKALRINSVGYGVSQALPVVVELLTRGKSEWIAIQQPEVHLHPKAQAALGNLLFHAAIDKSQVLLVETHSDYLLDRFRLAMRNHEHPDGFAQVVFFERKANGNHVCPMIIDKLGEYPKDQPKGFRAFFLAEQKLILGV